MDTPTDPADQTIEETIAHDSDPDTDEDQFNHRFDGEGNMPPPQDD